MDKEKLKKIKVLYYPYKAVKKIACFIRDLPCYVYSLHYIKKNKQRVQKKIENKETLNVVFVVQYIPGWNKLEPIYTKMKKDSRFNPIIVCVPLNIKNHQLMDDKGNDTYQYMTEHGYEAIDALQVDGSWYDLKNLAPDYLFHSRPYNHFMPEPYISGEIVKYALICNVMYGLSLVHNVEPVLLNKDYFRDCYCYFAFSDGEKDFYCNRFKLGIKFGIQRCLIFGGLGIEQILCNPKVKVNNGFRMTVMWTPRWSTDPVIGGSNFFNYRDNILKFISENKDILFIIRPHPLMFNNFKKTGEMSQKEIADFKSFCENTNNVILDEAKEYMGTFWQTDLLITDSSAIVPEFFFTNQPMMFCSSKMNESNTDFFDEIISGSYRIDSKEELEKTFNLLVSGVDEKKNERKMIYSKYYDKFINNSQHIIETLAIEGKFES